MIDTRNALEWTATSPLKHRRHIAVVNAATFEKGDDYRRHIDLVAVERAVNADYPLPRLTYREKLRAARLLFDADEGPTEIGLRVGVTVRTAQRWVNEWRAAVSA